MTTNQGFLNAAGDVSSDLVRREFFSRGTLWNIHGLMMGFSVFIVMPLGAVVIRRNTSEPFKNHWILQTIGGTFGGIGIIIGFFVSHHITLIHQFVGLAIFLALCAQAALGVSHHMSFVRTARTSKYSVPHIWLGRAILVGAGVNFVLGVYLRRWSTQPFLVFIAFLFFVAVAAGVGFLLWRLNNRKEPWRQDYEDQQLNEFNLDDISEDEDDEEGLPHRRSDDRK